MSPERRHSPAEDPLAASRYHKAIEVGRRIFADSIVAETGHITPSDVIKAKTFLKEAAKETKPPCWIQYWEHVMIASEMGRRLAENAKAHGMEIDPAEVEFKLWIHDGGRIVTPSTYLRNDIIGERMLRESGIPSSVLQSLPSNKRLMVAAENMGMSVSQQKWQEELTAEQKRQVDAYFESLTPTQRIVNLADNLGKRTSGAFGTKDGLFTSQGFIDYLKTQETRYGQEHPGAINWSNPRRQAGARLQAETIEKTFNWLKDNGVDFDQIRNQLLDYGPKFVVIARHGELDNPKGIVYTRDSLSKVDDIMHLNQIGKEQMAELAKLLKGRGIKPSKFISSPNTRTKESAQIVKDGMGSQADIFIDESLDDNYAYGTYLEGITLEQHTANKGEVYDSVRWGQYNHEQPDQIRERMFQSFWKATDSLSVGQTAVLVSHGDPIAWLVNHLLENQIPSPKVLREYIYPGKGEAVLAVTDPKGGIFTLYKLEDPNKSTPSRIY